VKHCHPSSLEVMRPVSRRNCRKLRCNIFQGGVIPKKSIVNRHGIGIYIYIHILYNYIPIINYPWLIFMGSMYCRYCKYAIVLVGMERGTFTLYSKLNWFIDFLTRFFVCIFCRNTKLIEINLNGNVWNFLTHLEDLETKFQ